MSHRRSAVLLAGVALVVLPVTACTGTNSGDAAAGGAFRQAATERNGTGIRPVADRPDAPPVRGELLDGSAYDVATLRGQVVVLNFWGSWCAPCLAEAANLESVYRQTKASGVAFVGIDVKDQRASALAHDRKYGISYPSIFDPSQSIPARFRELPPTAIPSTLVIDRAGRIAARFLGAVTVSDLLPVVQRIAAETA